MKTVTAFVGSPRKKGATYSATRQFLDSLESFGDVQSEIVFLSERNVGVCRGCKSCFVRGEEHCPLKDERDLLVQKMMISDGVVFAAPNYSFQVPAVMKTYLDRLGYLFHRPCFHGKTFTPIVVQGFHGGDKVVKYLEYVGSGLGFNVVNGSCTTALDPMGEKELRKMAETLEKHSRRFHAKLLMPAFTTPSLYQLMVFRMGRTAARLLAGDDNRDHTYYRDRGWFDSDYFYPTRLGPLKQGVGAAFDWTAARMIKQR